MSPYGPNRKVSSGAPFFAEMSPRAPGHVGRVNTCMFLKPIGRIVLKEPYGMRVPVSMGLWSNTGHLGKRDLDTVHVERCGGDLGEDSKSEVKGRRSDEIRL